VTELKMKKKAEESVNRRNEMQVMKGIYQANGEKMKIDEG